MSERGFAKRHGGAAGVVESGPEFVTTTATASTLWPFPVPAKVDLVGGPLGSDSWGRDIHFDPLASFRAGLLRAPQLGIVGSNGSGKSHAAGVIAYALYKQGCPFIVPADFKGEWVPRAEQLGGTHITVDRDGGLNLVDPGEVIRMATEAGADDKTIRELCARRDQAVSVVLGLSRRAPISETERSILRLGLRALPPGSTIHALADAINDLRPDLPELMKVRSERIMDETDTLVLGVSSVAESTVGDSLGTSSDDQRWPVSAPLAVDTRSIHQEEDVLSAAVLVTAWAAARSSIHWSNLNGQKIHALIFEEIWRATREFPALADQIGGLLRLDRDRGLVTMMITHSWSDTAQSGGSNILNRCASLMFGGMQVEEIKLIRDSAAMLTEEEISRLAANAAGGSTAAGAHGGVGKFLFKANDDAGSVEIKVAHAPSMPSDTNNKWT